MNFLRTHPVFFAIVGGLLVIVGVEVWVFYSQRAKERELETRLDQQVSEIERLQRVDPGPTDQNFRLATDDYEQSRVVLSTMLRALNVVGADELEYFKGEPKTRTDAYFDIAQFVDRMRATAADVNVALKEGENFGFAMYTNKGPEPELIQPVYRQRRIVEYLLSALFAARPDSLVAVQREVPQPANGAGAQIQTPKSGSDAGDFFTIDGQVSARTPGYVNTTAIRIIFTGQTTALRGFMNALAAPEIPLVVRSVEVDSNKQSPARTGSSSARSYNVFGRPTEEVVETTAANVPIVANNDARFTVTIEMFEVNID